MLCKYPIKGWARMNEVRPEMRGQEAKSFTANDRAFQLFFEKAETIQGLEKQNISTLQSLVKTLKMPQVEEVIELLIPKDDSDAEN